MQPKILWDMDGTLVDSEPLHEAALENALYESGIKTLPGDFHDHLIGRDMPAVFDWCREHLRLDLSLREFEQRTYRAYLTSVIDLLPREGAVDLFLNLREKGYDQAVVSNSDRIVVNANLDASGLNGPGLISVSRNDVLSGKPSPEPYHRAASLFRTDPAGCLVIEDSTTGAEAGVAAGMRTLFWPQSEKPTPDGAVRVNDFSHLIDLIEDHESKG